MGLYDEALARWPVPYEARTIATRHGDEFRRFTVPEEPFRRRLSDLPDFVTARGGAYFFLPGRNGLDQLVMRGR